MKIYKTTGKPHITYGSESRTITKANEERLRRVERKILRKVFGPYRDPPTTPYRIRTNNEIKELYNENDIVREIRAHRVR